MFNPFKKKEESVKVIDRIWMSVDAKWNSILELCRKNPETIVIAWFDSSLRHLESILAKETSSMISAHLAREMSRPQVDGKQVIFAEHHPMRSREQELFKHWQLKEAIVYSALDEPLFQRFGSGKIIHMMKQMGMKEDEMIEHAMVSAAIENAQEKIEKKILAENSASSQEEWMERNLPV